MQIQRQKNEIIVKIPTNINADLIQQFLDYINFKTTQSNSKATLKNITKISAEINKSWWKKNKKRFLK